jgi:protein associated with RNAse G/E
MDRDSFHAVVRDSVTVNSRKYGGRVRRTWTGGLVSRSDELIVLVGRFDSDVEHSDLGFIRSGTVSFEHFWLTRWYNIFRFHEPDGKLKAWYCNIAMPPTFDGSVLDFTDLDLDVVVWPDMSYQVLDRDDFERNSLKYGYPDDVRRTAEEAVNDLRLLIDNRAFPFRVEIDDLRSEI